MHPDEAIPFQRQRQNEVPQEITESALVYRLGNGSRTRDGRSRIKLNLARSARNCG